MVDIRLNETDVAESQREWRIGRNPLLRGLMDELSLRVEAPCIMDGKSIFLPGRAGGVAKIFTHRGGILIAEEEYLPAEGGAAQVEQQAAISPYAEMHCSIFCRWDKIIRHHLHRWLGLRSNCA